jgi:hypothetical protein
MFLQEQEKVNSRSQKAQEKLPFIRLHIEKNFPEEHIALEKRENQPCVLNGFYREDFLTYIQKSNTSTHSVALIYHGIC